MSKRKVVLVGCGAVGTSFLYSAVNQQLAQDYVLIDIFEKAAIGNQLDLADTLAVLDKSYATIKAGTYKDCKDADLVVITAGRPQKPGETRIDMIADNAKIMKEIATQIKASGFKGVTLIASNPVDVITNVYQHVTGFDAHKVVGSGTWLDSARLRRLVADKLNVHSTSVQAYIVGEHGDSSVALWSTASVEGKPMSAFIKEGKITQKELDTIHDEAVNMAYKIIDNKRATFYGIGVSLCQISDAILNGLNKVMVVGAQLNGEYGVKNLYTGVHAVINENGWNSVLELPITKDEEAKFKKSCEVLNETFDKAKKALK